ncbi:hypothetical protein ACVOMS_35900 (plasmid) [Bradyrhizobium guangxiense]|uniref:hypothetical protein n=1 Tax=Bradyrhizobium guangxiense TaxID=1325115 RepID=UPI003703CB86
MRSLETTEPEIEVTLEFEAPDPLQIYRVEALDASEQHDFAARILRQNRKVSQDAGMLGVSFMQDSGYDDKYSKYREQTVPRHAARVHRYLEEEYGQIGFTMTIDVLGHIQAENLVIALRSSSGGCTTSSSPIRYTGRALRARKVTSISRRAWLDFRKSSRWSAATRLNSGLDLTAETSLSSIAPTFGTAVAGPSAVSRGSIRMRNHRSESRPR